MLTVAGVDLRGTSREALDLIATFSDESYVIHDASPGGRTFHPKMYLVVNQNEAVVVSGSGNFTQGGLFTNYEMFDVFRFNLADLADAAFLNVFESEVADLIGDAATAKPLDSNLIGTLISEGFVVDESKATRGNARSGNAGSGQTLFGTRTGLPGAPPPQIALPPGSPLLERTPAFADTNPV